MSRLRHDLKSYLTMLRMTKTQLIIFIEGKENDPVFYSQVAERFSISQQVKTEVWRAQELPGAATSNAGGSGGKPWLLKAGQFWLRYMRGKSAYNCRLIFALDKDIDDISAKCVLDVRFVYTQDHSVENYMISACDLQRAGEAALSLMPGELGGLISPSQTAWMKHAANLWRDWVEFCIVAKSYRHSKRTHGYSKLSAVNIPHDAPCSPAVLESKFEALRADAGVAVGEFDYVRRAVKQVVALEYANGSENKLLKGEWYVDILVAQIDRDPVLRVRIVQAGKHGIWSVIRSSFQLPHPVYRHYETAFLAALSAPF